MFYLYTSVGELRSWVINDIPECKDHFLLHVVRHQTKQSINLIEHHCSVCYVRNTILDIGFRRFQFFRIVSRNSFGCNTYNNREDNKYRQKDFFHNLGIDLSKIEIEKRDFVDNEEVPYIYSVNFLFCGSFLSMPKEQLDVYLDEEAFGTSIDRKLIESIETDDLVVYDGLGLGTGIRFKHPAIHFEEEQFQEWDCGFIDGALIVRGHKI